MKKQVQRGLSAALWGVVTVHEKHELMVEVAETSQLKLGVGFKQYQPSFFVRRSVANMLLAASKNLPEEYLLVLVEGYRSMQSQQHEWDMFSEKIMKAYPAMKAEEIDKMTAAFVAKPSPLSNHHCGGAVDVVLGHQDGSLVDCGTPYISLVDSIAEKKKFPMHSEFISEPQRIARTILRTVMEQAGFVWYPLEWWHYCYGDRMWAVYTNRKKCKYGPIYKEA